MIIETSYIKMNYTFQLNFIYSMATMQIITRYFHDYFMILIAQSCSFVVPLNSSIFHILGLVPVLQEICCGVTHKHFLTEISTMLYSEKSRDPRALKYDMLSHHPTHSCSTMTLNALHLKK